MDFEIFNKHITRILVSTAAFLVILNCLANNFILSVLGLGFMAMCLLCYSQYRENQNLQEWVESLERQLNDERGMWQ